MATYLSSNMGKHSNGDRRAIANKEDIGSVVEALLSEGFEYIEIDPVGLVVGVSDDGSLTLVYNAFQQDGAVVTARKAAL